MGPFMGLPTMSRSLSPAASLVVFARLPLPEARACSADLEPLVLDSLPLPRAAQAKAVHSSGICSKGTRPAGSGVQLEGTHTWDTDLLSAGSRSDFDVAGRQRSHFNEPLSTVQQKNDGCGLFERALTCRHCSTQCRLCCKKLQVTSSSTAVCCSSTCNACPRNVPMMQQQTAICQLLR